MLAEITFTINDDILSVDGVVIESGLSGNVKVEFIGDLANIDCTNLVVNGDVKGDVDCTNLKCGNIVGDVDATNVTCANVIGDIDAHKVTCKNRN